MQVDLVVRNARIHTLDPARPEASALAVLGGTIVAVDDVDDLRALEIVDLGGSTVVPGFNDAHCHPVQLGRSLDELDLSDAGCRDLDDVYRLVADAAMRAEPGAWIIGSRYDQMRFGGHPVRARLDEAAPHHRVWLKHTSGHLGVVNSAALAEAGLLSGSTPIPDGGAVRLDVGLVEERAQNLIRDLIPPLSEAAIADAVARAADLALSQGVTSWTAAGVGAGWAGNSDREIGGYQLARSSGRLGVRTTLMVTADSLGRSGTLDLGIRTGLGDDRLRIGALKIFVDGSLLGRTAALCHDYADHPGTAGYLQASESDLRSTIVGAHAAGWQVATHAIGDRAIGIALEAFSEAMRDFPRRDPRHRIEHVGILSDDHVAWMARLGIIPVPQGEFLSAFGDSMAEAVGPDRAALLYRQRSLLDAGLVLPGSSDRPVVPGAPLTGIRDLVVRRTAGGSVLAPAERLDPLQALEAWTIGSAYAEHAEDRKGVLRAGMLADFVVLGDDPLTAEPDEIPGIAVLATYVGGDIRFSART